MDCEIYYGPDAYPDHCAKAKEDFVNNETNWFIKCKYLLCNGLCTCMLFQ